MCLVSLNCTLKKNSFILSIFYFNKSQTFKKYNKVLILLEKMRLVLLVFGDFFKSFKINPVVWKIIPFSKRVYRIKNTDKLEQWKDPIWLRYSEIRKMVNKISL